jgi:hypothetical protein
MREFARDIARVGFIDGLRERVGKLETSVTTPPEFEALMARVLELEHKLGLRAENKPANDASERHE